MHENAAAEWWPDRTAVRAFVTDLTTLAGRARRECQPWCWVGDGHPNTWLMADQFCVSEARVVQLHAWPTVTVNAQGDEMPSQIAVVLHSPIDERTVVEVVLDDVAGHQAGFDLTCEEAHDLAIELLILVEQAKGKI